MAAFGCLTGCGDGDGTVLGRNCRDVNSLSPELARRPFEWGLPDPLQLTTEAAGDGRKPLPIDIGAPAKQDQRRSNQQLEMALSMQTQPWLSEDELSRSW